MYDGCWIVAMSTVDAGSPKSQFQELGVPNADVLRSVNCVGLLIHIPAELKSGKKPGYTRTSAVVESEQGWLRLITSLIVKSPVPGNVKVPTGVLDT